MLKTNTTKTGTVLITGASSGIGEALAACFAKAKFDMILVARNREKLNTLATDLHQRVIDLNITGLTAMLLTFLPAMVA